MSIFPVNVLPYRHVDIDSGDDCLMDFGGFVKAQRKKLGLTQTQLAKASGITQPSLSDIEKGETKLSHMRGETLMRLAKALKMETVENLRAAATPAAHTLPTIAIVEGSEEHQWINVLSGINEKDRQKLLGIAESLSSATSQQRNTTRKRGVSFNASGIANQKNLPAPAEAPVEGEAEPVKSGVLLEQMEKGVGVFAQPDREVAPILREAVRDRRHRGAKKSGRKKAR